MKELARNVGYTLIELIISLAVLSILLSAFLGIQVFFLKCNQISSENLNASIYAGNLYEKAKGMSIPDLSELSSIGVIWDDNIQYVFEAERYIPNNQTGNNLIDLVINYDCIDKYEGYVYGDSIHNLLAISGQGILIIDLIPCGKRTTIVFTDNSGKIAEYQFNANKQAQIINIHVDSVKNSKRNIHINIDEQPSNWQIYIHEHPFHSGNILIQYNDQTISTRQLIKPLKDDYISISSRKSETLVDVAVSLKITALKKGKEHQPICSRQGIIWIKP
ncbi:MAG TPA: prepilin-type N-terminal cleavage/methylation domain-containing protein [Clostridiales bacterium]|nr:prepilin-type N-terminal cleavage/methylation domain-containing protein [Clostridiales bacterium]